MLKPAFNVSGIDLNAFHRIRFYLSAKSYLFYDYNESSNEKEETIVSVLQQ